MSGAVVIFTATGSEEDALRIGRALVSEGLAACVNVIPSARSLYRWKGVLCDEREALLLIKSRRDLFSALRERIRSLHSYELPEVIMLTVQDGDETYLEWIRTATRRAGSGTENP
ncbi:divalent-cation tolerance protein CutA [bacterium]|nr:divalent-cation tolerance protein CutA [bacterium]